MLDILATIAEPSAPQPDTLRIVALLVGLPLLTIVVVAAAILGPQWSRAGRWRPGQPWVEGPVWLGAGDPDAAAAVLTAENTPALVTANTDAAIESTQASGADDVKSPAAPIQLGGARGQW